MQVKHLKQFYLNQITEIEGQISEKKLDLDRLEAQRNQLNSKVRMLREELSLLHEPGSYVGEVVKVMGKSKVLVKINPEGKFIVDLASNIDPSELKAGIRVALRNDSYTLHKILPSKVDPLVSLMMVEKVPDSTYDMVGGLDKQIKEIKEVIELPIKHPELFEALGIEQPKGVLLYGPPGTGKTLLARAVAHHTDCKFIRVSGSELVQKYIGEGSRMVRELFLMAREHAPSIIFMDEIDSIGSSRGDGSGDSEVQRTMLELLNQLDGFEATKNIKVIMATNRIDILDSALLRPGRIDRKIEFPPPNEQARVDILKIHSRKMNLVRGIDLMKIAEKMSGCSGAEAKGVCTEAGMFALRERRVHVTQEDFEMAVAKVMKKDSESNMSIRKLFNITFTEKVEIVQITDSNIDQLLNYDNTDWIIVLYTDWCSYCKRFKAELVQLADKLTDFPIENLSVKIGICNIDENTSTASRFFTTYLPSIYHVKNRDVRTLDYSIPMLRSTKYSNRDADSMYSLIESGDLYKIYRWSWLWNPWGLTGRFLGVLGTFIGFLQTFVSSVASKSEYLSEVGVWYGIFFSILMLLVAFLLYTSPSPGAHRGKQE